MMKIGVVSDTHKHIRNLESACAGIKTLGANILIHLGDDYEDCDPLVDINTIRVPGVFGGQYQDSSIPNRRIEIFSGWRLLLTHTVSSHPNDLTGDIRPEDLIRGKKIDIVLYGHTHIPDVKKEAGVIFINPGHLKNDDKRGHPPTYGIIILTEEECTVEIRELNNHQLFVSRIFKKGE
jgi:putative phosphoesterase